MLLSFVLSLKSVAFVQLVILLMVVFCVELVLGICCFLQVSTAFGFSWNFVELPFSRFAMRPALEIERENEWIEQIWHFTNNVRVLPSGQAMWGEFFLMLLRCRRDEWKFFVSRKIRTRAAHSLPSCRWMQSVSAVDSPFVSLIRWYSRFTFPDILQMDEKCVWWGIRVEVTEEIEKM